MFEKSIYDWEIFKNEDFLKNGLSISIGTYSNNYLSIVDCLALLKLADKTKEKDFLKYLAEQNNLKNWFSKNDKDKHINFIKKWGINPYCFFNMEEFMSLETDFLDDNKDIKENEYISENKIKKYIDSKENHLKLIKVINESKDITDLYKKVLSFKEDIKEDIINNVFDFISSD